MKDNTQSTTQKSNYLSVKDFASRAGVSTQRIYQMLGKELKMYCKIINKRKCIDADGLRLFEGIPIDLPQKQKTENVATKDFANILQAVAKDFATALQPNTDSLNSTMAILEAQLAIKDEQIKAQNEQIKAQNEQIKFQNDQIANLSAALQASQALHAGSIKQQLETSSANSKTTPSKCFFSLFFKKAIKH